MANYLEQVGTRFRLDLEFKADPCLDIPEGQLDSQSLLPLVIWILSAITLLL